jgi:hypothetical protein
LLLDLLRRWRQQAAVSRGRQRKSAAAADRRCDRTFAPTCGCYQDGGSILRTQRTISIFISRYQLAFRSTPVQFCGENSKHGERESAVDVRGYQAKSGAQEITGRKPFQSRRTCRERAARSMWNEPSAEPFFSAIQRLAWLRHATTWDMDMDMDMVCR